MKLLQTHASPDRPERRGAALLLSFLVLLVIIAIVFQINIVTKTDARVARNDVTLTRMDLAIDSALLEVYEMLAQDGEAGAEDDGGGAAGGDMGGGGDLDADGGGGGGGQAVDSRMDDWGRPQQTTINELSLRIVIQDEDSKYNILNMLHPDEEQAQEAYERVARILDRFREDTEDDVDGGRADEMATAMREHMLERSNSPSALPRPTLLTDNEENERLGFPMSLSEFAVVEPFEEMHFRDYFDRNGDRVHSISSFLTMWTSPVLGTGGENMGGGRGGGGDDDGEDGAASSASGYSVNLNTAPLAVLASLMDDRDVSTRFWDGVLEYRNAEEEPEDDEDEELEPMLDEFGEEILRTNVFDAIDELEEVYDWGVMEPDVKAKVEELLTVQSNVFSIYITARVSTEQEMNRRAVFEDRQEQEEYERSGAHLTRTVRSVVWRREGEESGTGIVPLIRWEVLDYSPLEVLDYPEDY